MKARTFDYIIVGAGSAGCTLANRLSADANNRVLLIEAGPPDRNPYIHLPVGFAKLTGTVVNWGYSTVPQPNVDGREMWYPQGRVLGGSSSINAQVYTRGHPKDYDEWTSADGCVGWSYKDVLPYFRRAEDNESFSNEYHGTGGPLGVSDQISPHPITKVFLRAAQEVGLPFNPDFNGSRQEGCGLYQVTQRKGRRCSTAVGYLKPVLHRPNLTLLTDVHTTRILIEHERAIGIELVYASSRQRGSLHADREVIVTAGAIGSPKLLMLSGIGPADELKAVGVASTHDLPGVGRNLQDHMDVYAINELTGDHSYDKHLKPHKQVWAGIEYLLFRRGPVASNLAEGGAFWFADSQARSPDIQFHFMVGSGLEHGVEKLENCGVTLNSAFLRPRSRGSVRLRNADPFTHPLIDPNYWGDPYDRKISIEGFRIARRIMASPSFKPFVLAERLPGPQAQTDQEIAAYARKFSKTDYHPVGTCKMGVDEMAVVDPSLRVRGLRGLRVCDASVMPRLVSSNTNAATIMIAEKAADHILGKV